MKIVSAKSLMKLPEGTLFCEDVTGNLEFGKIEVKGETIVIDGVDAGYYSASLDDFDPGNDDIFHRLNKMAEDESQTEVLDPAMGKVLPIDLAKMFLVYQRDDLLVLREVIESALAVQGRIA